MYEGGPHHHWQESLPKTDWVSELDWLIMDEMLQDKVQAKIKAVVNFVRMTVTVLSVTPDTSREYSMR